MKKLSIITFLAYFALSFMILTDCLVKVTHPSTGYMIPLPKSLSTTGVLETSKLNTNDSYEGLKKLLGDQEKALKELRQIAELHHALSQEIIAYKEKQILIFKPARISHNM